MAKSHLGKLSVCLALGCFLGLGLAGRAWAVAADDDAPLDLAPVAKPTASAPAMPATQVPTAEPAADKSKAAADEPVDTPTALPTEAPTMAATPVPKAKPKPAQAELKVLGIESKQEADGLLLVLKASGPIMAKVAALKSPDRLLVKVANARLQGAKRSMDLNMGEAVRARLAQNRDEVWLVVDLLKAVPYKTVADRKHAFGVKLQTGTMASAAASKPAPAAPSGPTAQVPKVQMMLFDKNVMFEGKQHERFPCANLIYDKADAFPLEREFTTILVFAQGFGAFVGNLRLEGPDGKVLDQTREPFAFNLFNALTDHFVETPWKVRFERKGWHRLVLTLNGEDALEHKLYVGHNDDKP
jgi:hypothetical protein